jgi:glycosyltransferase involved in cell wall biosynthesis
MRTYWNAHGLAALGHEVHVVTNAKEAQPPFRMYMRPEDWDRCEAASGIGSVTLHWSDPVDRLQAYIPMASPFVSKLSAIAARLHLARPFDVIYSHYLEPYGVAGCLAAQITGVPHVVRMAGSDAGRLWHHPQLETLYDHVLRSAATVIATGVVAERAIRRGIDPERIVPGGHFVIPEDVFTPGGPVLDLAAWRTARKEEPGFADLTWGEFSAPWPCFGVYGKLGESKGTFALLAALERLKNAGHEVGLVALAHGTAAVEQGFRARVRELGLVDRVLQLPFLPHWRVPEFLRGCLAVCCLEQDFPIGFHSPIIPREVLLCARCLVGSTEVIRKLPGYEQLPDRYGCVAIEDVNNAEALAERLAGILQNPELAAAMGERGRRFAQELQQQLQQELQQELQQRMSFPQPLERILEAAAERQRAPAPRPALLTDTDRFRLTRLVVDVIGTNHTDPKLTIASQQTTFDLNWAQSVLALLEREIANGRIDREPLAAPVRVEIAIAMAEADADNAVACPDPLFRLTTGRCAIADEDFPALIPLRNPLLRLLEFEYDVSDFLNVQSAADFPATLSPLRSHMVVFGRANGRRREALVVDRLTALILGLSDGTRTIADILREVDHATGSASDPSLLAWIEQLFVKDLIALQDQGTAAAQARSAAAPAQ